MNQELDLTAVKDIAKCEKCEKFLDSPVILPCYRTICLSHITEIQLSTKSNVIDNCFLCGKTHEIPNNGFQPNLKIKNLIESNVHLDPHEKQLKIYLENLVRKLTRLIVNLDKKEVDAENTMKEKISEIKIQIDTTAKSLKLKIDELTSKLLKKLEDFENKCKRSMKKINKSSNNHQILNDLKIKWNEKQRDPAISLETTCDLKLELETKIDEVETQLKEFEQIRLLADKMSYKASPDTLLDDNLIGELEEKGKFKLVTAGQYDAIKIWDLDTGKCETNLNEQNTIVFSFAISPNGQLISGSCDGSIKIWDLSTLVCKKTLKKHSAGVHSLIYSQTGELISGFDDGTIKIWDLNNFIVLKSFKEHTSCVNRLVCLPYNEIASCSDDCTIKIWNLVNRTCAKTINNGSCVICLIITPDQTSLISGDIKGILKIWDILSGARTRTLGAHISGINSFECIKHEEWLISGDTNGVIKIWNLKSFECLKILEQHTSKISLLRFLENNQLVSVSRNNVVKLWDLHHFECIKTLQVDHIPGITCSWIILDE